MLGLVCRSDIFHLDLSIYWWSLSNYFPPNSDDKIGFQCVSAGSSVVTNIPPSGDIDGGGGWAPAGSSVCYAQFCCEPKTALKSKVYRGKKGMLGSAVTEDNTVAAVGLGRRGVHPGPQTGPKFCLWSSLLLVKDLACIKHVTSPNPACELSVDNVTCPSDPKGWL